MSIPFQVTALVCIAGFVSVGCFSSKLEAAEVVAVGASQTYGQGVPRGSDYPAQLQKLLRAKGIDVTVKNAGISGATTGRILANLDRAIDPDTRLVILQPGSNDRRKGKQEKTEKHMRQLFKKLDSQNIPYILLQSSDYAEFPRSLDKLHLTKEGYAQLAQKLLPKVVAKLR